MAISAKQVNELRKTTGAGMMDCKKALIQTEGDFDKAIDVLRKQGQKVAAKRASKDAYEGKIWLYVDQTGTTGIGFALNCETESVARNENFLNLGNIILEVAKGNNPQTKEDLLKLSHNNESIEEHIMNLMGKIGEKITISEYVCCRSTKIISYSHGEKIGVLVKLDGNIKNIDNIGKDLAMQIAAMSPISVDKSGLSNEIIAKEREIAIEKAKNANKPEDILDRIADGAVRKFIKENTLLGQAFIKNTKMDVKKYLIKNVKGLEVKGFSRISIS